jgi:hypothetical protein
MPNQQNLVWSFHREMTLAQQLNEVQNVSHSDYQALKTIQRTPSARPNILQYTTNLLSRDMAEGLLAGEDSLET